MESINLGDNVEFDHVKLDESCVFVEDSELHAVSCRAQKLGSYKVLTRSLLSPLIVSVGMFSTSGIVCVILYFLYNINRKNTCLWIWKIGRTFI